MELVFEAGAELVPVVVRGLAAAALTLLGAVVEFNALTSLSDGELAVGAWMLYVGGLALYAGLFVVGPDALERLSDVTADAA